MKLKLGRCLLNLATGNLDEGIVGYYTKYDCSAADINRIGGINKRDLKSFLGKGRVQSLDGCRLDRQTANLDLSAAEWAGDHRDINILGRVAAAAPSAELTGAEGAQLDEEDMGMSYDELGVSCSRVL